MQLLNRKLNLEQCYNYHVVITKIYFLQVGSFSDIVKMIFEIHF